MKLKYDGALELLLTRSFGGSDGAAVPDGEVADDFFTEGPLVAGAEAAAEWFKERLQSDYEGCAVLVLVGAPGNGKSYIAKKLTTDLHGIDSEIPRFQDTHRRKYEYKTEGNRDLVVINDASIPPKDEEPRPLVRDIDKSLKANSHILINVNRGILCQEIGTKDPNSPGQLIVNWLESKKSESLLLEDFETKQNSSLRGCTVTYPSDPKKVHVCVVYMDGCSLMESNVEGSKRTEDPLIPPLNHPYELKRLDKRDLEFTDKTPAGLVMKKFVEKFPATDLDTSEHLDPFYANCKSLQDGTVRVGVITVLRSAEIAAARRFSYRELWGAISLMILGVPEYREIQESENIKSWLEEVQPPKELGLDRLEALVRLASLRLHQSIFGAPMWEPLGGGSSFSPVLEITRTVDPIKDAKSGSDPNKQGWASNVYAAFYGQTEGESILRQLLNSLPDDDVISAYLSELDWSLDEVITKALDGKSEWLTNAGEKRSLIGWYGGYLVRMYAVCHGHPAFEDEISEWVKAWIQADTDDTLSSSLTAGLNTLLFPKFDSGQSHDSYLPLLDSQVEPIVDDEVAPRLAVRVSTGIHFYAETEGDLLFVDLTSTENQEKIVRLEIDFRLLREVLACSGNFIGLTELTSVSIPRIERFRSAVLNSSKKQPEVTVIAKGVIEKISSSQLESIG